jgi:capsular exopolysaccharide synthesis family protein
VTLLVEPSRNKVVSIDDVYGNTPLQAKEYYQTQVEILKSRDIAVRTAAALKLWQYREHAPRGTAPGVMQSMGRFFGLGQAPTPRTEAELAALTGEKLMEKLSIEPVRLSQLVKVSFESSDPVLAAKVANAVASNYIEADREARFTVTQQANTWIQARMSTILKSLANSEAQLQAYREKLGLVNLAGSSETLINQQVTQINQRLADARAQRMQLESTYREIERIRDGDYSRVPGVVHNPTLAQAQAKELEAASQMANISQRLGVNHESYKQAEAALNDARNSMSRLRQQIALSARLEYEAAMATEQKLEAQLALARGSVQQVNRQEFQLSVLEREVATNRQLYDMFMSRAKETNLTADLQAAVARIVDPAVVPAQPLKPRKGLIVVGAGVMSLLLGAVVALLLARLDNTIKSGEDAESRLHLPVLTALPRIDATQGIAARFFLEQPASRHAEAIRTARTGVLLSNLDDSSRRVLVTSSLPGEGKTTLCTNLALAHSQTKRTILLDADLRKPQAGTRLGIAPDAKGLSNFISGTAELHECLHTVPGSTLMVMPAGTQPPNPQELLQSRRFAEVLDLLSAHAEIVIIDSPPVEVVSDAMVIAPLASSAIYVIKAMSTATPVVRKGLKHLERAGAQIMGVVVNSQDFSQQRSYRGSYYGGDDSYYGPATPPTEAAPRQLRQG